jgi:glycosyltransferase involved in cell wall biosynthesis
MDAPVHDIRMDDALIDAQQPTGRPGASAPQRRLAVCHVASGDRWAGAESQVATLLRVFSRDRSLEVSAIILNEGRLVEELRACGIAVKVIAESQHGFWSTLSQAAEFVRQHHVDVIHSHRYKENLLAAMLARRCDVPVVVRTQHGMPEPFAGLRSLKNKLTAIVDRAVARFATDRVIVVTDEMKATFNSVPTNKVVIIHNGIDVTVVNSRLSRSEAKRALGVNPDDVLIGTAGRLEPIKRIDLFLAAADEIGRRLTNAHFVVVGDGSERKRLEDIAANRHSPRAVQFLGDRSDIFDVLRAMDLFVISSDHEGLPMVLLEALYLGTPVVARAVGGIPEVLCGNLSAGLVRSADAGDIAESCLKVLQDTSLAASLAQSGQERVAGDFSSVKTAAQVVGLYRSLISDKAAAK